MTDHIKTIEHVGAAAEVRPAETEVPPADGVLNGRPFFPTPGAGAPMLAVIVYHYVREMRRTRFPGIKGLTVDEFRAQVRTLRDVYQMATLESALAFLTGTYRPTRSLCLLTFDDGLRDHYADVLPTLRSERVQGVFFVTTGCLAGKVAAVHKNHHLMALLDFNTYRQAFLERLSQREDTSPRDVDWTLVKRAYPWDTPDVASFKFLLNYQLAPERADEILGALFAEFIGPEHAFVKELYLSWAEAREMQREGMVIGGHSHDHRPLSQLDEQTQLRDLTTCAERLRAALHPQPLWPFSYPYGQFNATTVEILRRLAFTCSFALEGGTNHVHQHAFQIRRIDTKDLVFA